MANFKQRRPVLTAEEHVLKTSTMQLIARNHGFVWHYRTAAPKNFNPAAALKLGEADARWVNRFCVDLNSHYFGHMLFHGRQKPSLQSLKKELWAGGDKAQATVVSKLKQLTDLHRELKKITADAESAWDAWGELYEKGRNPTEGEMVILESLDEVGLPPDTFNLLSKLREEIKTRVKDGTWEKSYLYWRKRWLAALVDVWEMVTKERPVPAWSVDEPTKKAKQFIDFCIATTSCENDQFRRFFISPDSAAARIKTMLKAIDKKD
jgi:hypothetical protein